MYLLITAGKHTKLIALCSFLDPSFSVAHDSSLVLTWLIVFTLVWPTIVHYMF